MIVLAAETSLACATISPNETAEELHRRADAANRASSALWTVAGLSATGALATAAAASQMTSHPVSSHMDLTGSMPDPAPNVSAWAAAGTAAGLAVVWAIAAAIVSSNADDISAAELSRPTERLKVERDLHGAEPPPAPPPPPEAPSLVPNTSSARSSTVSAPHRAPFLPQENQKP